MNVLSYTLQGLTDYLDERFDLSSKGLVSEVKRIIEEHGDLPPDIQLRLAYNGTACMIETVGDPYCFIVLFVWDYSNDQLTYPNESLQIPNIYQKPLREVLDKAIEVVYLAQIEEAVQRLRGRRLSEHYYYLEERFGIPWRVFNLKEWTTLGEILSDEQLYEVVKYLMNNKEDIPYTTYRTLWLYYKEVFDAVEANDKAGKV